MGTHLKITENLPMSYIAMCWGNHLVIAGSLYSTAKETFQHMNGNLIRINPRTFLGLCGNGDHCKRLYEHVRFRKELYENNENREMIPEVIAIVISNFLYEQRFDPYNVEAMIVSLHPKTLKPYICNIDSIGGINVRNDFGAIGGLNKVDRNHLRYIHRHTYDIVKAISETVISWEREIIKKNITALTNNREDVIAHYIKAMHCGVTINLIESDIITKIDVYDKNEMKRSNSLDPRLQGIYE